jgi:hypothetical protein
VFRCNTQINGIPLASHLAAPSCPTYTESTREAKGSISSEHRLGSARARICLSTGAQSRGCPLRKISSASSHSNSIASASSPSHAHWISSTLTRVLSSTPPVPTLARTLARPCALPTTTLHGRAHASGRDPRPAGGLLLQPEKLLRPKPALASLAAAPHPRCTTTTVGDTHAAIRALRRRLVQVDGIHLTEARTPAWMRCPCLRQTHVNTLTS